jgi:hypothetical protein
MCIQAAAVVLVSGENAQISIQLLKFACTHLVKMFYPPDVFVSKAIDSQGSSISVFFISANSRSGNSVRRRRLGLSFLSGLDTIVHLAHSLQSKEVRQ